jgi:hypothetical protein
MAIPSLFAAAPRGTRGGATIYDALALVVILRSFARNSNGMLTPGDG